MTLSVLSAAAIFTMLGVAVICDLRSQFLPWQLTIGGLAAAFLAAAALRGSLVGTAAGVLPGLGVLVISIWLGWILEGDALLLAAIGAWSSMQFAWAVVWWASIAGALFAIPLVVKYRQ